MPADEASSGNWVLLFKVPAIPACVMMRLRQVRGEQQGMGDEGAGATDPGQQLLR